MPYPVISSGAAPAPISTELSRSLFDGAFAGFSGGNARFLKPRKGDFVLSGSGGKTIMPNGSVQAVLLAVAPYNHCTWYRNEYQPGQEARKPDLQWIQRDPTWFPNALPEKYRQKIFKNGRMMWDFRTARRTVWAFCTSNAMRQLEIDLDNPVVFDMTSMSMFGPGDLASHCYKWAGLKQFCMSISGNGVTVTPQMFVTQILLDPDAPTGVVFFKPLDNTNNVVWLDEVSLMNVVNVAQSDMIQSIVEVSEILGGDEAQSAEPVQAPPAQAAPVQTRPAETTVTDAPPARSAARPAPAAPQSVSVLERARRFLDEKKPDPAPAPLTPSSDGGARSELLNMLNALGE